LLLLRRKLDWRSLALVVLASLIPLFPYFLVVASHGMAPFTTSFATRPVSGWAQLTSNAGYMLHDTLPVLFFSHTADEIRALSLPGIRLLLVFALLVVLALVVSREQLRKPARSGRLIPPVLPFALLLFGCLIYPISGAGSVRGWTVRYAVPLWLVVPLAAALIYHYAHQRRIKLFIVASIILLACLDGLEYPVFSRQMQESRIAALADERSTLSWLQSHHRDLVVGDYWTVYSLNFDGGRSVIALPIDDDNDYFHYDRELQGREMSAVLLDNNADHLQQWAKRIGRSGHLEKVTLHTNAYLFDKPLDASAVEQARAQAR
jgi:hypothetical protein